MTTVLERISSPQISSSQDISEKEKTLAKSASELFGYEALAETQKRNVTSVGSLRYQIMVHLEDSFNWLPFKPEAVKAYKRKKSQQHSSLSSRIRRLDVDDMIMISMIAAALSAVIAIIQSLTGLQWFGFDWLITMSITFPALVGAVTYLAVSKRPSSRWHQIPVNKYGLPIPEIVLSGMTQLKETFGDKISFSISHLTDRGARSLMSVAALGEFDQATALSRWLKEDPFLNLYIHFEDGKKEMYTIAVWDEPNFKAVPR